VCVRARERARESGDSEKILEKRVKYILRERALEEASASASPESVRESSASESGWDLRILEKRPVKYM
jgi:hypothetical protein